MNDRGPNDLEEKIRTLEFRNEVLHKANQKQQDEILDLRAKVRKLEHDAVQQFRNKGEM
jgi:chaperonin cofactor prefoldin